MRLDNLSGYFDVRVYKAQKPREQRDVAGQEQTITFGVVFNPNDLPKQVSKYAHAYKDKNGEDRMFVTFKISKGCKFFEKRNGRVTAIERPDHAGLEGKRFDACIDFRELNGDPAKQEACGYWANGILISEAESSMFADLNDPETTPEQTEIETKNETAESAEEALPF